MANIEEFVIKLRDDFSKGMNDAKKSTNALRESFGGITGIIGGAVAGIGIASYMNEAVQAFDQSEKAVAQVKQGILTTGGVAGKTFSDLEKQASELQKITLFDDDQILNDATAVLLTFTNITGENFDKNAKSRVRFGNAYGRGFERGVSSIGQSVE